MINDALRQVGADGEVYVFSLAGFKDAQKILRLLNLTRRTPEMEQKYSHLITSEAKLFQYNMVLVPVQRDEHYITVAILPKARRVVYYNSLATVGADNIGREMADIVWKWLEGLLGIVMLQDWRLEPAKRETTMQQSIFANDSGPIAMMNLRVLAFDVKRPEDDVQPLALEYRAYCARRRIATELFGRELNPSKEYLTKMLGVVPDGEPIEVVDLSQAPEMDFQAQPATTEPSFRDGESTTANARDSREQIPHRRREGAELLTLEQRIETPQRPYCNPERPTPKVTKDTPRSTEQKPGSEAGRSSIQISELGNEGLAKPDQLLRLLQQRTSAEQPLTTLKLNSPEIQVGIWYDTKNEARVLGKVDGLVFEVQRLGSARQEGVQEGPGNADETEPSQHERKERSPDAGDEVGWLTLLLILSLLWFSSGY